MSNRENGSGGNSSGRRNYPKINPDGSGYGQRPSEEKFTAPRTSREPSGYGIGEEQGRSGAFRDREGSRNMRSSSTRSAGDGSSRSAASGRGSQSSGSAAGGRGNQSSRSATGARGSQTTGSSAGRNGRSSGNGATGRGSQSSGGRASGRNNTSSGNGNRNASSGRRGGNGNGGNRNSGNSGNNGGRNENGTPNSVNRFLIPEIIVACVGIVILLIVMIPLGKNLFHTDPVETLPPQGTMETPETLVGDRKDLTPIPKATEEDTEPDETETTTEEYRIDLSAIPIPDFVTVDLIEPNEYSRPQKPLKKVNDIVVHWVGNAGTSGAANVGYFKQLGNKEANPEGTKASSNFVIGLEGEVYMCVPIDEVAYCSNHRNSDTISIECCHPDWEGKYSDATYASLIRLLTYLCNALELDETHIIRHFDVTGKECPRYYVKNPDAWEALKLDLRTSLDAHPVNDGSWY